MAGNVLEFTDASFQSSVLDNAQPVLVDFWAPWCGPCKLLAPAVDQIANEYAGKVSVGKLNTDDNPQTAIAHQITSIPTLMLFKNGEVVSMVRGLVQKEKIASMLDQHLG